MNDQLIEVGHECPICKGEMEYLGTLGCLAHYRCRDCGIMTNEDEGACG
jgi:transposase-like protein